MNAEKTITQFELLPNEILIECFKYLNACDLFHSFDQLNDRFNHLIRHIRLNINFQNVNKSMFDEFCAKILLNPKMKNQIYSLYFPFDAERFQIRTFLSLFSPEEFPNLEKYGVILPSITPLSFSDFSDPNVNYRMELTQTLFSKLRTLSIAQPYEFIWRFIQTSSSISNLIVDQCGLQDFSYFLRCLPKLKYFHLQPIENYTDYGNEEEPSDFHFNYHLKQLIIDDFNGTFNSFRMYVEETRYLQSLTISSIYNIDLIDAHRWEQLITTYLPSLTTFKFIFHCYFKDDEKNLIDNFNQFRTDFWQKHQWFTEYVISDDEAYIYTIPYLSNTSKLRLKSKRYSNNPRNNVDTFTNVTNLILYQEVSTKTSEYYFPNVTSLTLTSFSNQSLTTEYVDYLKKIVNLFYLKHLDIRGMGKMNSTAILLKFHKTTPHLNSFAMHEDEVASLLNDQELCNYLNKMITRLYIYRNGDNLVNNWTYPTEQFNKTFCNIEHLLFEIGYGKELGFLLSHFPKLSTLHLNWRQEHDSEKCLLQLTNEVRKLNLIANINTEPSARLDGTANYDYDSDGYEYCRPGTIWNIDLRMWLGENTPELLINFMNVMNSLVKQ